MREKKKKSRLTFFFPNTMAKKELENDGQSKIVVYQIILKIVENPQTLLAACQEPTRTERLQWVWRRKATINLKGDVLP